VLRCLDVQALHWLREAASDLEIAAWLKESPAVIHRTGHLERYTALKLEHLVDSR
jgi:hypothetical protein